MLFKNDNSINLLLIFSFKKSGEYYVKVMKKIQEKGVEYVTKELARLQRMLGNVNIKFVLFLLTLSDKFIICV